MLEELAVSQGESEVTVKGTVLPVPTELTWNDWEAGLCEDPAEPEKFRAVVDTCSTGLAVTTSVTGTEETVALLLVPIRTVVV
jgi:hypothetical protein